MTKPATPPSEKMSDMSDDLHRLMLEGNPVFQSLRLRAEALEEENRMLLQALEAMNDVFGNLPAARNYPHIVGKARAAIAKCREGK